jgi:hypothetical protein
MALGRVWLYVLCSRPSHDTLTRVIAKLLSEQLHTALPQLAELLWATLLPPPDLSEPPVVALDGKEIKGASGKLNLVSAWASHPQLTLAVQAVPAGTNEIPAVQQLLRLVDIRDSVVTADALHCQKQNGALMAGKNIETG